MPTTTIVLVHGAHSESAGWSRVLVRLREENSTLVRHGHMVCDIVAVANPLRGLPGDATYLADVVRSFAGPTVLVGHGYGGMVITEAAARVDSVLGLVYVAAFAPDTGESADHLASRFPGSIPAAALTTRPLASAGSEVTIARCRFGHLFGADLHLKDASLRAVTQRPVARAALADGLQAAPPAWKRIPSWFVFGDQDRIVPVELHRFLAQRAASVHTREVRGASHAIAASHPDAVADAIIESIVGASLEPIA